MGLLKLLITRKKTILKAIVMTIIITQFGILQRLNPLDKYSENDSITVVSRASQTKRHLPVQNANYDSKNDALNKTHYFDISDKKDKRDNASLKELIEHDTEKESSKASKSIASKRNKTVGLGFDPKLTPADVKSTKPVKEIKDVKEKRQNNITLSKIQPVPVFDPNAPGEMGKGVTIDEKTLSPGELRKYKDGWDKYAFNEYVSDKISLHRTLKDHRPAACRKTLYPDQLPDTSVIIIFYNEAWSVLLRTVHSVLDRSPRHLLREIILVDDSSDFEHLHAPLERYLSGLEKVRLVRSERREGLIHARLLGASAAEGRVLTFLDSHCEVSPGWLEPLLYRVSQNETNVVCPVISTINLTTFSYASATAAEVGGFDWNLLFLWFFPKLTPRPKNKSAPVRSPAMAGGLFSISKAYFEILGRYDPGMMIWGGENLEMSFKIWMCGGSLEILPCSNVGHVFRMKSPFSWKLQDGADNKEALLKKNRVRLAEVWLDDYKKYFYQKINYDLGDFGDVSERKNLREQLQCKSFDWYMKNIYPDKFVPDEAIKSGSIRSRDSNSCLDHSIGDSIRVQECNVKNDQRWFLSKHGEVRADDAGELCLDLSEHLIFFTCNLSANQIWEYTEDSRIRHRYQHVCLQLSKDGTQLEAGPCKGDRPQQWVWDNV